MKHEGEFLIEKQCPLFQEVPNMPTNREVSSSVLSGWHIQLLNTYWFTPQGCSWRWNLDLLIFFWNSGLLMLIPVYWIINIIQSPAALRQWGQMSSSLTPHHPLAPTQPISFHTSDTESIFCNLSDNSKVFSGSSSIMPLTRNNLTRIWQDSVTEMVNLAFDHFYRHYKHCDNFVSSSADVGFVEELWILLTLARWDCLLRNSCTETISQLLCNQTVSNRSMDLDCLSLSKNLFDNLVMNSPEPKRPKSF